MHLTPHFFHFFRNRELNEMYVSLSIRSFALSIIGVFVPIYFYLIGFSLTTIFFFYILQSAFHIVLSVPVTKFSSRFGTKHSMLLSSPVLIIFFLLLYSIKTFSLPLPLLAFFGGLATSAFWIPYHIDFAKFSDRKNRGKEIGFSSVAASLLSVFGPLVGALILTFFGFKTLFLVASGILVFSSVPLFFSKDLYEPFRFSLRGFFEKQKVRDVSSFLGHGIEGKLNAIVWPLFIFIFIFGEKYTSLGVVSSLTLAVSFVYTMLVGKFSDIYRKTLLKIGGIFNAVVWVGRSFVITPAQVFIVDAFYGLSNTTMHIPFDAINYDKAYKENLVKLVLEREIYHHVGVIILFVILIFFVNSLEEVFRYGGSLSSLMRFFF